MPLSWNRLKGSEGNLDLNDTLEILKILLVTSLLGVSHVLVAMP